MANKNAWVLVETVEMYRMRYIVECTEDNPEYAINIVKSGKANEFSQKHIGETITSARTIPEEEALELCAEDNQWGETWTWKKEPIIKNHFTRKEDLT